MSRVATKPSPDKPRNAWSEDKDGKYSEKEMENLLQKPALQLGPQEDWWWWPEVRLQKYFRGLCDVSIKKAD